MGRTRKEADSRRKEVGKENVENRDEETEGEMRVERTEIKTEGEREWREQI